MPVTFGQLLYTESPEIGLQLRAGAEFPIALQQAFVDEIVAAHWNAEAPQPINFRAAFLHQIAADQTIFGWMYVETDSLPPYAIPLFIGYCLNEPLNGLKLELIAEILTQGPVQAVPLPTLPEAIAAIEVDEALDYRATRLGVAIPSSIVARSRLQFDKGNLLNFFVPVMPVEQPPDLKPKSRLPELRENIGAPLASGAALGQAATAASTERQGMPPTRKLALLIGVSQYGPGFTALPGVQQDVESLKAALSNPLLGGFNEVHILLNPDRQSMEEAIERLFAECQPRDLVLLYFSGFGVKDSQGNLSLCTGLSRRGQSYKVVRSTIIPADFLKAVMDDSASQQQVVILDYCVTDAAPRRDVAGPQRTLGTEAQLGGDYRTILTTCPFSPCNILQKEEQGSSYTSYLVEGIETGAADLNRDGVISLQEWHEYAKFRVQRATPAMNPKLYLMPSRIPIWICMSPLDDSKLNYRNHVERCITDGRISPVHRIVLNALQGDWELSQAEATRIEVDVLKPYQVYCSKVQLYAQACLESTRQETSTQVQNEITLMLDELQAKLGLTDADIVPVESEILRQLSLIEVPNLSSPVLSSHAQRPGLSGGWLQSWRRQITAALQSVVPDVTPRLSQSGLSQRPQDRRSQLIAWLRSPRGLATGAGVLVCVLLVAIWLGGRSRKQSESSDRATAQLAATTGVGSSGGEAGRNGIADSRSLINSISASR